MLGRAGISEEDPYCSQLRGPIPHQQPLRHNRSLWVPEDPLQDISEFALRRDSHKMRRDSGKGRRDYSPSSGCDFEMIFDHSTTIPHLER